MIERLKAIRINEEGFLEIDLKSQKDYDEYMFEQLHRDGNCIAAIRDTKNKNRYLYDVKGYISLNEYLKNHIFQKEEGYLFFIALFHCLLNVNKNKPILLDASYIFLSRGGEQLRFIAIPLVMEQWTIQTKESTKLMQDIAQHIQVENEYELSGFFLQSSKKCDEGFVHVLRNLEKLWEVHKPKKKWLNYIFHKEEMKEFDFQEPVRQYEIKQPELFVQEKEEEYRGTVVLFEDNAPGAYLYEKAIDKKVELITFPYLIGRSRKCDYIIARNTISLRHAMISYENGCYMLEDLDSSNGTFLNGEKIEEKCELMNGDLIKIARVELQFLCEEML